MCLKRLSKKKTFIEVSNYVYNGNVLLLIAVIVLFKNRQTENIKKR